ncbi:MAG: hypothetical protein ACLFR1_02845 [Spirochaetia bacterium]
MTAKTGEVCEQSGMYRCKEHIDQEIALSEGETFPPCKGGDGKGHAAVWVLERAT